MFRTSHSTWYAHVLSAHAYRGSLHTAYFIKLSVCFFFTTRLLARLFVRCKYAPYVLLLGARRFFSGGACPSPHLRSLHSCAALLYLVPTAPYVLHTLPATTTPKRAVRGQKKHAGCQVRICSRTHPRLFGSRLAPPLLLSN